MPGQDAPEGGGRRGMAGRISKLSGHLSYPAWSTEVWNYARIRRTTAFLDGSAKAPEEPSGDDGVSGRKYDRYLALLQRYEDQEADAKDVMMTSMTKDVALLFDKYLDGTAAELWEGVKSHYSRSSYTQQCRFVGDLTAKLEDFDGNIDKLHSTFRRAEAGLLQNFRAQIPYLMDRYGGTGASGGARLTEQDAEKWFKTHDEVRALSNEWVTRMAPIEAWLQQRLGKLQPETAAKEGKTSAAELEDLLASVLETAPGEPGPSTPGAQVRKTVAKTMKSEPDGTASTLMLLRMVREARKIMIRADSLSVRQIVRWTMDECNQIHTRVVTVPMYLRAIESDFSDIVTNVKSLNGDPREIDVDKVMGMVLERIHARESAESAKRTVWNKGSGGGGKDSKNSGGGGGGKDNKPSGETKRGPCKSCGFPRGHAKDKKCWVEFPDEAPEHLRDDYRERHKAWKKTGKAQSRSVKQAQDSEDPGPRQLIAREVVTEGSYSFGNTESCKSSTSLTTWVVDSGATCHAVGLDVELTNRYPVNTVVKTASGLVRCTERGTATLRVITPRGEQTFCLNDAIVIPGLEGGLVSVHRILKRGLVFRPDLDALVSLGNDKVVTKLEECGGSWYLRIKGQPKMEARHDACGHDHGHAVKNMDLWHRRLAHASEEYVRKTLKGTEEGKTAVGDLPPCPPCLLSKSKRRPNHEELDRPEGWFQHLTTDLCGPITPEGINRANYVLLGTDRATSYRWGRCLRTKAQATQALIEILDEIKTQYGREVKTLTTDGSAELHPPRPGLIVRTSAPYTPEQNGMAEAANRVVIERARTTMIAGKLPAFLWPEAVLAAVHVGNRIWTRAHGRSPIQQALKLAADIPDGDAADYPARDAAILGDLNQSMKHLRVYGCKTFVNIPSQRRVASRKMAPRAEVGAMVGYNGCTNYRVWIPARHAVVITPHATFHEDALYYDAQDAAPPLWDDPLEAEDAPDESANEDAPDEADEDAPDGDADEDAPNLDTGEAQAPELEAPEDQQSEDSSDSEIVVQTPKPRQRRRKVKHWVKWVAMAAMTGSPETWSYRDVMMMPEGKKTLFLAAAREEVSALQKNGTWELVAPRGRVLSGKWVFTQKRNAAGEIVRYKARWVVRGFAQRKGLDYNSTSSNTVNRTTVKLVLTLATSRGWHVQQMDVTTAFLHPQVDQNILVEQPTGFDDGSGRVCRLKKALYGLKQSPRLWERHVSSSWLPKAMMHADPTRVSWSVERPAARP